jgi:hypothetical protein
MERSKASNASIQRAKKEVMLIDETAGSGEGNYYTLSKSRIRQELTLGTIVGTR